MTEFPELTADGPLADDLIYEEIHIRRQHGETVSVEEYATRFPQQVAKLGDLLATDRPGLTSALHDVPKVDAFEAGQCVDDFDLLLRLGKRRFRQRVPGPAAFVEPDGRSENRRRSWV